MAPSEQSAADAVTAAPAPGAPAEAEPERSESEEASAAGEGASIPKQQSAAETADSEAGEGART
ncbi:gliding motility protein [Streptomyces sp. NPDC005962]|uniref:gliding motility protein n=1 Tax=Streptomyces sp. NPDC005962 TaxID=3154466 RepID=UPI0033F71C53